MRVLGIDPGIDDVSYAIIDDGHLVDAGLVRNSYKKKGKVEKLLKATHMALDIRNQLLSLDSVDYAYVEASTASADGLRNYNTMCRMALVSGAALGSVDAKFIDFVPPQTWKCVRDKADNQAMVLKSVSKYERDKLNSFLIDLPKSKHHNVIDAYCIALWGYNQNV